MSDFHTAAALWKSLFVCLSVYGWGFQRGVPFGSVEKEIGGRRGKEGNLRLTSVSLSPYKKLGV